MEMKQRKQEKVGGKGCNLHRVLQDTASSIQSCFKLVILNTGTVIWIPTLQHSDVNPFLG